MQIGDHVKYIGYYPLGEVKGEIARFSNCKYFGHKDCTEELLSLTWAPELFYHSKNFIIVTD